MPGQSNNFTDETLSREHSDGAGQSWFSRYRRADEVKTIREIWMLREQARVQAAERQFLQRLQHLLENTLGRIYRDNSESLDVQGNDPAVQDSSHTRPISIGDRYRLRVENDRIENGTEPGSFTNLSLRESPQYRQALEMFESNSPPTQTRLRREESHGRSIARDIRAVTNSPFFTNSFENTHSSLSQRENSWQAPLTELRNVSNALNSSFRNELEFIMESGPRRRNRNGGDSTPWFGRNNRLIEERMGPTAEDRLEDYGDYHAGGYEEEPDQDLSSSSVAAATAVPLSSTPNASALVKAIVDLQREVNVLKNAIAASFDMQLDIQRSIRQEVSASMNSKQLENVAAGSDVIPMAAATLQKETFRKVDKKTIAQATKAVKAGTCVICLEHAVDSVLYTCGHMCACSLCARTLLTGGKDCPMCRAPVRDVIRAYALSD